MIVYYSCDDSGKFTNYLKNILVTQEILHMIVKEDTRKKVEKAQT